MPWFGEPWPSSSRRAPVCEVDDERVDVPTGTPCVLCDEAIVETDSGTLMAARDPQTDTWGPKPVHRECSLREVLGGAGHLSAPPHGPGECDPDAGLPRHQSALLVQRWVERMDVEDTLRAGHYPEVRDAMRRDIEAMRRTAASMPPH